MTTSGTSFAASVLGGNIYPPWEVNCLLRWKLKRLMKLKTLMTIMHAFPDSVTKQRTSNMTPSSIPFIFLKPFFPCSLFLVPCCQTSLVSCATRRNQKEWRQSGFLIQFQQSFLTFLSTTWLIKCMGKHWKNTNFGHQSKQVKLKVKVKLWSYRGWDAGA